MDIHIHTQYMENYGSRWKAKGGDTFVVEGANLPLNSEIGKAAQAIVDALKPGLEYSNDSAEQYIIDWELVEDGTLTQWEKDQQEYEGKITSPSPRLAVVPVVEV